MGDSSIGVNEADADDEEVKDDAIDWKLWWNRAKMANNYNEISFKFFYVCLCFYINSWIASIGK